jgi:hypothetical protein
MRKILAAGAAGLLLSTAGMAAQEALGAAMTLRGEIVEVSCFSKGVAQATGTSHVACAKECAQKGQPLAILTEEDGVIKITGDYAANKYAKLLDFVGKQVEVRGTSDRYLDYSRAIKVTAITPAARQKR